jgi:hypothetical protein
MLEFTHGGFEYRGHKIDTFKQMDLLARIGPLVAPMFQKMTELPTGEGEEAEQARNIGQVTAFLEALHKLSDEERKFVAETCLASLQRKQGSGTAEAWAWIFRHGRFMFEDVDNLGDVFALTAQVLGDVLGGFLSIKPGDQGGLAQLQRPTLVSNG